MAFASSDLDLELDLERFEKSHRVRLSATAIDEENGIVRGCTVAQSGVQAAGKFVLLDAEGKLTRDPLKAVRKLPVWTDDETLSTLLAAVEVADNVLKVRSDHDDALASRAGFASSFRLDEREGVKRVACDLQLLKSYRDRGIFLETAKATPGLIGLSIDFEPRYDLRPDRALMRVAKVYAVDIVDEGAITRDGLFLSARVDKSAKFDKSSQTQPSTTMAAADDKKKEDAPKEPSMSEMIAQMTALGSAVKGCMEGLAALEKKLGGAAAAPAEGDAMAAIRKEISTELAAVKEERTKLAADRAELAKTKAALGVKDGGASADDATAATREQLAKQKEEDAKKAKPYLALVDEAMKTGDFKKRSDAHLHVQRTNREAYAAHLSGRGVYDPTKDPHRERAA